MKILMVILLIQAIVASVVALFSLNQGTLGVGAVGFACLWAILARMAQASLHHRDTMDLIALEDETPDDLPERPRSPKARHSKSPRG